MPATDNYTEDVLARLSDFTGPGAQWQRRLWDVGLVVALRELREASDAVQAGVLSNKSVKWLGLSLDSQTAHDPGAGSDSALARFRAVIKGDLTTGGAGYAELADWIKDIDSNYLTRWKAAVGGSDKPSREAVARALATHLIGERFSPAFLRGWLRDLADEHALDAAALVTEVATLVSRPDEAFEVMVLFAKPPSAQVTKPDEWRSPSAARKWLEDQGFAPVRQHGGLLLCIPARDPFSAAETAGQLVDRLHARAAVGSRDRVLAMPESFVAGHPTPLAQRNSRRAEVRALGREQALMRLDQPGPIDQSLELLANLNTSPDAVAAAAGWSAVESLLSAPGDEDKVVTADRLADLVACSWPRAELTTIAWARVYQAGKSPDVLATELQEMETNRARAERILLAIRNEENLGLLRPAEQMALRRMEKLVRSPREQLLGVQARAAVCLRRLYRQRNLVVHGGLTAGFSLNTALKIAAPLVGAGLDRLTHGALVDGRHPLELAARARFEIHRAGSDGATELTALLE